MKSRLLPGENAVRIRGSLPFLLLEIYGTGGNGENREVTRRESNYLSQRVTLLVRSLAVGKRRRPAFPLFAPVRLLGRCHAGVAQ